MPAPKPKPGQSESEFMGVCVPFWIDEGKEPSVASAICHDAWMNRPKKDMNAKNEAALTKGETLFRTCEIDREATNQTQRTVQLSFSSEEPYPRWFGNEVLGHKKTEMDLSRLNGKGAFLLNHNRDDQIGVIEKAWIDTEDRKGRATVRFSKSAKANEIFQDVLDGIRVLTSVGYSVKEMVLQKTEGDQKTYRVTRWTPLEVSLVSVPADATVGVGRQFPPSPVAGTEDAVEPPQSADDRQASEAAAAPEPGSASGPENLKEAAPAAPETAPTQVLTRNMKENETAPTVDLAEQRKAESNRIKEILALGKQHKCMDEAQEAIANGVTVDAFKSTVLAKYSAAPVPAQEAPKSALIGMSEKEIKRYSLVRAIGCVAANRPLDGIEREASDEVSRKFNKPAEGFWMPYDMQLAPIRSDQRVDTRALLAGSGGGAYTVATEVPATFIDALRNRSTVITLGGVVLTGLTGNVAIPRLAAVTAQWLAEGSAATDTVPTIDAVTLSAKKLMTYSAVSKQLLVQSSVDVEAMVRNDAAKAIALALDKAFYLGAGTTEPTGLDNLSIGTVTFGTTATRAKALDFVSAVDVGNALTSNLAWVMAPASHAKWRGIDTATTAGKWLIDDDLRCVGYPAWSTNQVGTKAYFGNWSEGLLGLFGPGIDITVDPYGLVTTGQIRIVLLSFCDLNVRHLASFCRSTDSAAQ